MAKITHRHVKRSQFTKFKSYVWKYANPTFIKHVLQDVRYLYPVSIFLLVCELIISLGVVKYVRYTEIDWKSYMQEVEGFINGTLDYSLLKGDTGPLVYPAGFVYIYSFLYYLTNQGLNIKLAQYIFVASYILLLALVFRLFCRSRKVPPFVLVIMCFTSYRIHSIFMLRLFNDPFAVIFLYAAVNFYIDNRWTLGSIMFSLAVSVKMNILLYSPALLLLFLTNLGLRRTMLQLIVCGMVQLMLGLPFLVSHPISYIYGAFDLTRIFLHKWTVNWRFVPEEIFIDRVFHLSLMVVHIILLGLFYKIALTFFSSYAKLKAAEAQIVPQLKKKEHVDTSTSSQLMLLPLFVCNFIGVTCSRSLHYQFYIWYYHTLPYLLWCSKFSTQWRLTLFGIIELCWNTYPSTDISSAMLNLAHLTLLFSVFINNWKITNFKNIKK